MMSTTTGTTPAPTKPSQNKRNRKKKSIAGPSVAIPDNAGSTTDPATPVENGTQEPSTGQTFLFELAKYASYCGWNSPLLEY